MSTELRVALSDSIVFNIGGLGNRESSGIFTTVELLLMVTNVTADIIVPVKKVQDGLSTADAYEFSRAIVGRIELAVGVVIRIRC